MSIDFSLDLRSGSRTSRLGTLRVLLVEDNAGDAVLVREMLEEVAARVDLVDATSVAAALRELALEPPACVLLDLHLPDAAGFDGLHRVLDASPAPVIVITGHQDDRVGEAAVDHGAADYVVKGRVDGDGLKRTIRHAVERHEARLLMQESEARFRSLADDLAVRGVVITDRDVTNREEAERARAHRSRHDLLTGLPDRQQAALRLDTCFPLVDLHTPAAPDPQRTDPPGDGTARFELDAIAAVAHELRTPITVIRGFSEMMTELVRNGRTDLLDGALDAVHRQTTQMERIVADLADVSAVAAGEPRLTVERVDLRHVVELVVEDLRSHLEQHQVEILGTAIQVAGDSLRLRQILTNLLTNAAKFAPTHTTVRVQIGDTADGATIRVTDEGPGVPVDREAELFGKFNRLGATAKGMGIGLYLSRKLARAHGGDLTYRRAPAGGAEFTLQLPVGPTGPETPGSDEVQARSQTRSLPRSADPEAMAVVDQATRRLLQVQLPEQVVALAIRLVRDLGGAVAPASVIGDKVLPADISFGVGEPLVVVADPSSIARRRLELVLPSFLEDARDVVHACRLPTPLRRSRHDPVTGLLSRRGLLAMLSGDDGAHELLVIGLDDAPAPEDLDAAMRWLSRSTIAATGDDDLAGRCDQHRLVVTGRDRQALEDMALEIRERWERHRPVPMTVSSVVVRTEAGAAAGRALTRATKALGQGAGACPPPVDARVALR